jgi:hypothetical protein
MRLRAGPLRGYFRNRGENYRGIDELNELIDAPAQNVSRARSAQRAAGPLRDRTWERELASDADVAGLGALFALNNLELDLGALIEGGTAEIIGVYEHVFAAVVRGDEAETFIRIEKFNCTFLHAVHIPHIDAFVKP